MRNIVIALFLLILTVGCSGGRVFPSRSQVQKRKSSSERINDAARTREREIHLMRGSSRDDPSPRY